MLHKAFDGEVYYWWDDDRQQASKVSAKKGKPVAMNDRDRATAKRVIKRYLDNDTNDHQLENELTAALTTARREAREEALRDAERIVGGISKRREDNHDRYITSSRFQIRACCALERAANAELEAAKKGETDAGSR